MVKRSQIKKLFHQSVAEAKAAIVSSVVFLFVCHQARPAGTPPRITGWTGPKSRDETGESCKIQTWGTTVGANGVEHYGRDLIYIYRYAHLSIYACIYLYIYRCVQVFVFLSDI